MIANDSLPVPARTVSTAAVRTMAGLAFVALFVVGGCASAGRATGVGGVGGFYAGSLFVDGRPFGAAMNLRGSGANRVRGVFSTSSPVSIEGDVDGAFVDGLLRIAVEYRTPDGCDGRIEGILDVSRGGEALEGPVTVSDCQEPVAARLVLRRRSAQTSMGTPPALADAYSARMVRMFAAASRAP